MYPHIFTTLINGKLQQHYSYDSVMERLLLDVELDAWLVMMIRSTMKSLRIGESYSLFNNTCSITRNSYLPEEQKFYLTIMEDWHYEP